MHVFVESKFPVDVQVTLSSLLKYRYIINAVVLMYIQFIQDKDSYCFTCMFILSAYKLHIPPSSMGPDYADNKIPKICGGNITNLGVITIWDSIEAL